MAERRRWWIGAAVAAAVVAGTVPAAALTGASSAQAADRVTTTDVAVAAAVPGATLPTDDRLLDGPGGQPWWVESAALKTVSHGALVTHPLPAGGQWRRASVTTGPDQSLWLLSEDKTVVARVEPGGSFASFPVQGTYTDSDLAVAVDGAAWVTQLAPRGGWMAVRIAADGTQTAFPESGDEPFLNESHRGTGYADAGPEGSVWATNLYTGVVGIYPDGHTVHAGNVAMWPFQAAGVEYVSYSQTSLGTVIARVNSDGSLTTVATNVEQRVSSGDQGFYTTRLDAGHETLHRLGMPGWHAVIDPSLTSLDSALWVPGSRSLWLTTYVPPPDGSPHEGSYATDAIAEDGRVTHVSNFGGFELAPDGTLWANSGQVHVRSDGTVISRRPIALGDDIFAWGVSADGATWLEVSRRFLPVQIFTTAPATVTRLSGDDRYETAVAVAKRAFPTRAPVVYLAAGANFPDALAAGPAAAAEHAALLLTTSDGLPAPTATELKALAPGRVVIVGGTASIGSAVERSVHRLLPSATVQRRSGATRYETANQLVGAVFHSASTVYVASGATFPDALGAGAAAGSQGDPLLLVDPSSPGVAASTAAAIARLHPARIVVVGGPSAVTATIVASLGRIAPTSRIAGEDRYATSLAVAKAAFPSSTSAFFASGENFPDAMSGAVLAASTHSPVYAVQNSCLPAPLGAQFTTGKVTDFTIVGGPSAVIPELDDLWMCAIR
ncbi:cell wall-binding repeat-containing protein [Leifsonia sp. NPDC102414]|uniref:cell wall-binding repeat-containing protein n=1 Tax=Leifsonia sp. NPDC102414 TaxID=3364124 RepID=UPI003812D1AA